MIAVPSEGPVLARVGSVVDVVQAMGRVGIGGTLGREAVSSAGDAGSSDSLDKRSTKWGVAFKL